MGAASVIALGGSADHDTVVRRQAVRTGPVGGDPGVDAGFDQGCRVDGEVGVRVGPGCDGPDGAAVPSSRVAIPPLPLPPLKFSGLMDRLRASESL